MKLFIYDHCPYCTKARIVFGIKNINFELVTLPNSDVDTPVSMVSRKVVPILQKDDGLYMPESLDIVRFVDQNYGGREAVSWGDSGGAHSEISAWTSGSSSYLYYLCMPRWVNMPFEEFSTEDDVKYFTEKKEGMIGSFEDNINDSERFISQANSHLDLLEKILKKHNIEGFARDGRVAEYDIHLFAALRSLSAAKGLRYGNLTETYRQEASAKSKVSLNDDIAI